MDDYLYTNSTPKMVVLKCIGENNFYLEKVILPSETYWFNAPEESRVEIWQMAINGQLLSVRADVSDFAANASDPELAADAMASPFHQAVA